MNCLILTAPFKTLSPYSRNNSDESERGVSAYAAYDFARLKALLASHSVVTCNGSYLDWNALSGILEKYKPDCAIVDSSLIQDHSERHRTLELFRAVKEIAPEIITIWGGRDASALYRTILFHTNVVDIILLDESCSILPRLIDTLQYRPKRDALESLPGIAFRKKTKIVANRRLKSEELVDLDTLPFLDYTDIQFRDGEIPIVTTSRGCPFGCTFCYRQYRYYRKNTPTYVRSHIEYLATQYSIKHFKFDDDLFTIDHNRTIAVCDELARSDIDFTFECYSRSKGFSTEVAQSLVGAGCKMVWFGMETSSEELLGAMSKGQSLSDIENAIHTAKSAGIDVCCNVLVGFPGERPNTLLDTVLFLSNVPVDLVSLQRLKYMPDTILFNQMREKGLIDDTCWLMEDDSFSYEVDFSKDALDSFIKIASSISSDVELNEKLAKYMVFKAQRAVCECNLVPEAELEIAYRLGCSSVKSISLATNAATSCGRCARSVHSLLEYWSHGLP